MQRNLKKIKSQYWYHFEKKISFEFNKFKISGLASLFFFIFVEYVHPL